MKLKQLSLLLILTSLTVGSIKAQITVEGITFDKNYSYKNNNLTLNGAGLREKLWIDLYVAGLYVENVDLHKNNIADLNKPMAINIEIVSSLITGEKMADAILEGFEKSTNSNTAPIQKEVDAFLNVFKSNPFTKGDKCKLIYTPEDGVQILINDKYTKTIKGFEFKKALFNIWLGKNSVDDDLKKSLLKK